MVDLPASEFEGQMFAEIRELAMERAERFYPKRVGICLPEDWNVGSLKYDTSKKD